MQERMLTLEKLVPYSKHMFAIYEGERMDDMIDSIRENGVITPIIVRPIDGNTDTYEILSGHNRVEATRRLGRNSISAIIRSDLSDVGAALIVLDTNLMQRAFTDLRHSERAMILESYLSTLKAINGQGKRNDLVDMLDDEKTCAQLAHKLKSRDKVAQKYLLSKDTVARYVRIAKLPKEFLALLDNNFFGITAAVELSWLNAEDFSTLLNIINKKDKISGISLKQAKEIRELSKEGRLLERDLYSVLCDEIIKKNSRRIKFSKEVSTRLSKYNISSDEVIENIICHYLDMLERGEIEDMLNVSKVKASLA